jgi:hypothetical protein
LWGEGWGEYETLKRLRKSRRHKQVLDVQELNSPVCPTLRLRWQKKKTVGKPTLADTVTEELLVSLRVQIQRAPRQKPRTKDATKWSLNTGAEFEVLEGLDFSPEATFKMPECGSEI